MNEREITNVVAVLTSGWSGWSDETVALWWTELRSIHASVEDCIGAARALLVSSKFRPSWSEFFAEAQRLRREREQHELERRALEQPSGPDDVARAANLRGFRRMRAEVAGSFPGVVLVPQGMGVAVDMSIGHGTRGHDHRKGAAGCKFCSKHDHTDTRPIGFTVHRLWQDTAEGRKMHEQKIPVPAYVATCPRCGNLEAARAMCDMVIAPLGIEVLRASDAEAANVSDQF